MRITELLQKSDGRMADSEYKRLKQHFFFNLPIVTDGNGNVMNPPDNQELFKRFIAEANSRGEIFNPLFDDHAN